MRLSRSAAQTSVYDARVKKYSAKARTTSGQHTLLLQHCNDAESLIAGGRISCSRSFSLSLLFFSLSALFFFTLLRVCIYLLNYTTTPMMIVIYKWNVPLQLPVQGIIQEPHQSFREMPHSVKEEEEEPAMTKR